MAVQTRPDSCIDCPDGYTDSPRRLYRLTQTALLTTQPDIQIHADGYTDCPEGCTDWPRQLYRLAQTAVQTTQTAVLTCPDGCTDPPRLLYRHTQTAVQTRPDGCSDLLKRLYRLTHTAVQTCPDGCTDSPRWPYRLAQTAVENAQAAVQTFAQMDVQMRSPNGCTDLPLEDVSLLLASHFACLLFCQIMSSRGYTLPVHYIIRLCPPYGTLCLLIISSGSVTKTLHIQLTALLSRLLIYPSLMIS